METRICKLVLAYPSAAEDSLIDYMLALDPPLASFTTLSADGHGVDFSEATVNERVRGRVRRGLMLLILPKNDVPPLLEHIRSGINIQHLVYWIEPVEEFARLISGHETDIAERQ
jgi:hypothetical protein